MKRFTTQVALALALGLAVACSTTPPADDDSAGSLSSSTSGNSEFSEFQGSGGGASPEAGIENEIAGQPAAGGDTGAAPPAQDEFSQFDQTGGDQAAPAAPPAVDEGENPVAEAPAPEAPPEAAPSDLPAPEAVPQESFAEEPAPEAPAPAEPTGQTVNITNIQFRANDNGGTIIIQGDGPMTFQQRMNADTHQFVVEIPNSKLPAKLKRPFNTRDFAGIIGSIDAYQAKDSTTARVVVQLRGGTAEPLVQAEGNSLLVVAQPKNESGPQIELTQDEAPPAVESSKLMSSDSLEEFLSGNQNFYGKKISIETDEAELKDVFRMISEEANVNLILADEVRGKISLKLKNVPWDQALVMIMKSKKLGYSRAGNVLRIAPVSDLRSEEDDSLKYLAAKKANAPVKVKNITVNYAKVEDLEKQVKGLLTQRGTVVGDARTSSVVISDLEENVERAEKLIHALDIPPQQVLIEGKVVEASDTFERDIGVSWNATGRQTGIWGWKTTNGPLHGQGSFNVSPTGQGAAAAGISFTMGTLDVLGDLTASLQLFESQGLVKVLSSPRVVTLHNEPAEISQTTELPLITSTISANGQPVPAVSFKPVRLRLGVTPQITNDGAVIMGVDVSREIAGAVVDQATKAFPVNSRTAKTKVIVKNSQTAVIGGIYQNDMNEGESRVPGLGSLPVVGWLFKSKSVRKDRTELIIFLTPRILGQLEGAPAAMPNPSGGEF